MFNYDKAMADTNSDVFQRVKQPDSVIIKCLSDYKQRPILPTDDLFRVLVKKGHGTVIFSMDDICDNTNEYIIHAEDIVEFIFDEKDYQLVLLAEPIKGSDIL